MIADNSTFPKLIFPSIKTEELDETLATFEMKSYCALAVLETSEHICYSVFFATPWRVISEFNTSEFFIEPGLILVQDTKLKTMQAAARVAWEEGFFKFMIPLELE